MADDIGYECIGVNGSDDYNTPVLDSLSKSGIRFTNAFSQPLCTPSRVKIMTGKPNYENYKYFGYLGSNQKTFGNLFKENGYKTCIVGKWQLNGLSYKIKGYDDNSRPHDFGFDEYSLWQLTLPKNNNKERYSNPLIEQNGNVLKTNASNYGPDLVSDYAIDFIKRNKDNPFFLYYPMLLVHNPFSPTPDSKDWEFSEKRTLNNPIYFSDMVNYMDKIIGKIVNELKRNSILENTLLIFIGDNGTNPKIVSLNNGIKIKGAKGNTIKYGTNVPMFVNWNSEISKDFVSNSLIDFTDFYSTFEDVLKIKNKESKGISFLKKIKGNKHREREILSTYYDPRWGSNVNIYRNVYSQTKKYKLYKSGKFYNIEKDPLERTSLEELELDKEIVAIKKLLEMELFKIPDLQNNSPKL
jgi:arylsulfatase A